MKKLVCLLALCMAPQTCLHAQMVSLPAKGEVARGQRTVTFDWLAHVMGFTLCVEDQARSFVAEGLSSIDKREVAAHEAKHREQYERFGGCDAMEAFASTPRGAIVIEAEAYAAGLCEAVKWGSDRESLRRNFAERISYWITKGQVPAIAIEPMIREFERC